MKHVKDVMAYINYRNANPIPDVMTIMSGIGSPQEMVHTDEKWHTEGFSWGNARTRRKISGPRKSTRAGRRRNTRRSSASSAASIVPSTAAPSSATATSPAT